MSLDATTWAWKQELKSTDKIVLLSMADRAGEDHTCYPSVSRLAKDAGLNRKTVLAVLKRLREKGLIEKTGRSVGYNKSVPEYVLIGVRGREEETLVPKSNQAQNRDMYQTQKVTMSKSGHSPKSTPHQSQKWDGHQYQKWDTESPIEPPNESPSIYCPEFEEQSTPLIQQTLICTLPLNDGSAFEVTQEFVAELAPLYPNVDVSQALRAMKGWLIGNQTRRKTRRGIKAFITSWLSREQDKPRAAAVPQHGQVPQPRSYRECVDLEQRQEVEYLNQLREELNATGTNGADSLGAGQAQPALASGESVSRNRA